jgi:hypothetical protein
LPARSVASRQRFGTLTNVWKGRWKLSMADYSWLHSLAQERYGGCEADMTVYRSDLFTIFLKDLMDCWQQRLSCGVRWSITNSVGLSGRFAAVSGRSPRTKVPTEILQDNRL